MTIEGQQHPPEGDDSSTFSSSTCSQERREIGGVSVGFSLKNLTEALIGFLSPKTGVLQWVYKNTIWGLFFGDGAYFTVEAISQEWGTKNGEFLVLWLARARYFSLWLSRLISMWDFMRFSNRLLRMRFVYAPKVWSIVEGGKTEIFW